MKPPDGDDSPEFIFLAGILFAILSAISVHQKDWPFAVFWALLSLGLFIISGAVLIGDEFQRINANDPPQG